jgi:hypothetical protein
MAAEVIVKKGRPPREISATIEMSMLPEEWRRLREKMAGIDKTCDPFCRLTDAIYDFVKENVPKEGE